MNAQYSIRDIEKLTGVKAHTLRIWEQRYEFVVPHRTDTNIRYYDDEQLKLLINVSVLLKNGRKISHVAKMNAESISKEMVRITTNTFDRDAYFEILVDRLTLAMIDMDENAFEKAFSSCVLRYGFEQTMSNVITPFLANVGVLWSIGEVNVAQEHFVSNLVRQKLIVAIDALVGKQKNDKKYLLFLPEGEYHELGLLFAEYLIKSHGNQVIYLGQSLPYSDLVKLCHRYRPEFVLTYFTSGLQRVSIPDYLANMQRDIPPTRVLICGPKALETVTENELSSIIFLKNVQDLLDFIRIQPSV